MIALIVLTVWLVGVVLTARWFATELGPARNTPGLFDYMVVGVFCVIIGLMWPILLPFLGLGYLLTRGLK